MDTFEEGIAFEDYEAEDADFDQLNDLEVQSAEEDDDSWGDEENDSSDCDSDYTLISDEGVRCEWTDDISQPAMKQSDSSESEWEVVSVGSVISLSDCSVNNIAREIIEREQDLSGFFEPAIDEKSTDVEPEFAVTPGNEVKTEFALIDQVPEVKIKKKKANMKFGLVLFRKNGMEIALIRKKRKKALLSLVYASMKGSESPLDAAVHCFVDNTGCTNFDRFAALPNLIERTHKKKNKRKTYLFFPTIMNCKLQFLSDAKFELEWVPTGVVARAKKSKSIDPAVISVVNEAITMLEVNASSIPTLVDPETEELADMAHRDLLDYAVKRKLQVTSAEARSFLERNEGDLQKMFEDPTPDELSNMLRKLVMQLPAEHKDPEIGKDIPLQSVEALQVLQTFVAAFTNEKGKVKWSKVNETLLEQPQILVDPSVQQVLLQCGWDAGLQRFTKKLRKQRYALYLHAMSNFSSGTQA